MPLDHEFAIYVSQQNLTDSSPLFYSGKMSDTFLSNATDDDVLLRESTELTAHGL